MGGSGSDYMKSQSELVAWSGFFLPVVFCTAFFFFFFFFFFTTGFTGYRAASRRPMCEHSNACWTVGPRCSSRHQEHVRLILAVSLLHSTVAKQDRVT